MDFRNWLLVEELFANNSATIYHRTGKSGDNPQKSVEGIFSSGYIIGHGEAYGPGLYSTLNLEDQLSSGMSSYGRYLIKMKVDDVKNYLVFIPSWARKIYNDNTITLTKQVKALGINIPASDDDLKKIDDLLGFTPGTVEMKVVGDAVADFVHKYKLYHSTTNCKGLIYNDPHGYVLLMYPPFVNVTPIAWAEVRTIGVNPSQIEWNNLRNLAKVNFPEKTLDVKTRKIAYKVPQGHGSKKGLRTMTSKDFVAFIKDVKDRKKLVNGTSNEYEELKDALSFLKEKNLPVNLLFTKMPDSTIKTFGASALLSLIYEYSNANLDNNPAIIKILNAQKDDPYGNASQAYALVGKMTSKPEAIRDYILSAFDKMPNIREINLHMKNRGHSEDEMIKVLADFIERAEKFGKSVDITQIANFNPKLFIKIVADKGTITDKDVYRAVSNTSFYSKNDVEDFIKYLVDLNNPLVFTQGKAYQQILKKLIESSDVYLTVENIEKLIPAQEIKDYFNDPANADKENGYAYQLRLTTVMLLIKYKEEIGDKAFQNIIENFPDLSVKDNALILDALIAKLKTSKKTMTYDQIKKIIDVCHNLSGGGREIIKMLPEEYFTNLTDDEVRYLLNKVDRFENEQYLAQKIIASNNKISEELKDYLNKINNSTASDSPILMPTTEDVEALFGDKITKGGSISTWVSNLRSQAFKDKNKTQQDIDAINSVFESWLIGKLSKIEYTNTLHASIMEYLLRGQNINIKNILMAMPEKGIEIITSNPNNYTSFKNLILQLKSKMSQSDLDELATHFVAIVLQNPKLKGLAKTIPLIFGKKGIIYR
jgi:hypothetical protein